MMSIIPFQIACSATSFSFFLKKEEVERQAKKYPTIMLPYTQYYSHLLR